MWLSAFWYQMSLLKLEKTHKMQCRRPFYNLFFMLFSLHRFPYQMSFAWTISPWYVLIIILQKKQHFSHINFFTAIWNVSPSLPPDTLPVFWVLKSCENRWIKKWPCVYKTPKMYCIKRNYFDFFYTIAFNLEYETMFWNMSFPHFDLNRYVT